MAIIHMDGFDLYNNTSDFSQFGYSPANINFSTTAGRFGGGSLGVQDNGQAGIGWQGTFALELWTSFAIDVLETQSDRYIVTFTTPAGVEVTITYNGSTQTLHAYRGNSGGTLLGSASANLATSTWHWLDIHFKYHASAGIVEIWADGVQVMNLTGQNTANNSSQTALHGVFLGGYSGLGGQNSLSANYDDWVIYDTTGSYNNSRLGDSKIETLKPTSDASPNNGTPSTAGSHYPMVNESQWNTSNYITMTNTSGQEELYGMASLSSNPATISAVQIMMIAENTDAGSANLETVLVSGSSTVTGASTALTSGWLKYTTVQEYDPNTSAAWTYSAVNAVNAGWKVP